MNKTELDILNKLIEIMSRPCDTFSYGPEELFIYIYDRIPKRYQISEGVVHVYPYKNLLTIGEGKFFDVEVFLELIKKSSKYKFMVPLKFHDFTIFVMKDMIILVRLDCYFVGHDLDQSDIIVITKDINLVLEDLKEFIVWRPFEDTTIKFRYINVNRGIDYIPLTAPKIDVDLEKNYNSDLPLGRIKKFIESSTPGLVIFNGEPGTGKSSFLKYLISEYSDKNWILISSNDLLKITESHINYFLSTDNRNNIYILEDCEKLILKREKGNNLETFLNLTDGLLGDSMCPKFICTFNTPLSNIDQALLRKGRLKLIYEFKTLSLEKTKKHIPEATSPMTLADIYNKRSNGYAKETKKIGY